MYCWLPPPAADPPFGIATRESRESTTKDTGAPTRSGLDERTARVARDRARGRRYERDARGLRARAHVCQRPERRARQSDAFPPPRPPATSVRRRAREFRQIQPVASPISETRISTQNQAEGVCSAGASPAGDGPDGVVRKGASAGPRGGRVSLQRGFVGRFVPLWILSSLRASTAASQTSVALQQARRRLAAARTLPPLFTPPRARRTRAWSPSPLRPSRTRPRSRASHPRW